VLAFAYSIGKSSGNQMSTNAQQSEAAPESFAPSRRAICCVHESGHAVTGRLLFGGISGARINPDGTGVVWRGETPDPDSTSAHEKKSREQFADNENLLSEGGPIPFSIVSQHIAMWRAKAIFFLAGEAAERLAFGLVVSPPNSDQLDAKVFTRRCSVGRAGANLLLDHCRAESRALLQRHWPAVEAIARALDREGELDGEAVARLIAQNPPLR
jgi:hypothetical protein